MRHRRLVRLRARSVRRGGGCAPVRALAPPFGASAGRAQGSGVVGGVVMCTFPKQFQIQSSTPPAASRAVIRTPARARSGRANDTDGSGE
eukprot:gene1968-biopygen22926